MFGSLTGPQPQATFSIVDTGTGLAIRSPQDHLFPLVALGGHEYRLVGWSEERTVTTRLDGPRPEVELTYRKGHRSTRLLVPAACGGVTDARTSAAVSVHSTPGP